MHTRQQGWVSGQSDISVEEGFKLGRLSEATVMEELGY
jgi:hypothetical protein